MTNVNLMHGDCLERMSEIPDGSVDMILADLPYGTTRCKWDVVIPFEPLWEQYWRVIKANGAVVLFGSEPFSSHLRMSQIKRYKYDWVWKKNKVTGMLNAKHQPMRNHELISVFYKKRTNYNPIKEKREWDMPEGFSAKCYSKNNQILGKHKDSERKIIDQLRFPTTVKSFNCISERKKQIHPTQKPVPLLEYLIRTYTNEGETVLDNVMGSGSTGVACLNTNRKFIGIEKDAAYFEIAKNRIGECLG